jgi:hypothetical protein
LTIPDVTAKAANSNQHKREASSENVALHLRYQQIGISAVAAAVRYQGSGKNAAYLPAPIKKPAHGAAVS